MGSSTVRRRGTGRTAASYRQLPEHRRQVYEARRAVHDDRLQRRRRHEVPTWPRALAEIGLWLVLAAGFGALAWLSRPTAPPTAAVCLLAGVWCAGAALRPLGALLLGRHPVQVRERALCSVCGGLFLPGRAIRRHVRREESAGNAPARWTTIRVR